MITITKEGNSFRLRLKGIRTKFYAKNPKEIAMAVTHYFLSFFLQEDTVARPNLTVRCVASKRQ